jgi:hypothetical protein
MRSQPHVVENETDRYNVSIITYSAVNEKSWCPEMLLTLRVLLFNEIDGAKTKTYILSAMGGISGVGVKLEETE